MSGGDPLLAQTVRSGLEAIGWVRDERGLGGGRQMDGLAWSFPLDQLWEDYVAAKVQDGFAEGGVCGWNIRRNSHAAPMVGSSASVPWSSGARHRRYRRSSVWIVDAKYKSHFAEIDESGWRRMADEIRESHRADIPQILAYSALFEAREVIGTLAYPLRE